MRKGQQVAVHDVFGKCARDGEQTEAVIPDQAEVIKEAKIGDQYHLVVLEGDRNIYNSLKISFLEVNVTYS